MTVNHRTVEAEIRSLLEWYICECLDYAPGQGMHEWWSDGVLLLRIEHSDDTFKLLGVTWIGSMGTAPFEIDVELAQGVDDYFAKCTFRLGMIDENGCPTVCDSQRAAECVLEARPRCNRDWAVAIELTPPNKSMPEP